MSQTPPPTEGQEGPNPLELFYEKNKKWIVLLAIALVVGIVINYGVQYLDRTARNQTWRDFTAATALRDQVSKPVDLDKFGGAGGDPRQRQWIQQVLLSDRQAQLVTSLMSDVAGIDQTKLDAMIAKTQGTPEQPWMIWVAANRAYGGRDWGLARKHCLDLQSRFPDHILCAQGKYPPQVRKEKEDPEKKKGEDDKPKPKKPKLEPALPGSLVNNLLEDIEKNEAFREARSDFFFIPEPDKTETAIIKLRDLGEVEIAFYPTAAPKHVERFKKNFGSGYYKEMRIHKIKRDPKESPNPLHPRTVHLGHPKSKDPDRTKWKEAIEAEKEDILEFEAGMKNLSFHPFMVAAEQEEEGKSSARRFFICVNDCGGKFDGDYVIIGRVIRGQEHIEEIAAGAMLDTADENRGEGPPEQDALVESTELKKQ